MKLINIDGADIAAALKGKANISFFIQNHLRTKELSKKINDAAGLVILIHAGKGMDSKIYSKCVAGLTKHAKKDANVVWAAELSKKPGLAVLAGW